MKRILILTAFGLFGAFATVNAQSTPAKSPARQAADTEKIAPATSEAAVEVAPAAEVKEAPAKKKGCCSSKASASKASGCGSADKAHAHATGADGKACCASKGKAEARVNEDGTEEENAPSVR